MLKEKRFAAVVIGSSAGGIKALDRILAILPQQFPLPIIIAQHLHPHSNSYLVHMLNANCALTVKQAEEKAQILPNVVYLAPPNYHLLIEEDYTFSLSLEGKVNFSRPSIDVLFESAVYAYRHRLIGIILTGANSDGSLGLKKIRQVGGYTIVQDPSTAEADAMPRFALRATPVDKVLPLEKIGAYLWQVIKEDTL